MHILNTVERLHGDQHLSEDECNDVVIQESTGVDEHTIGYEVEVLRSVRPEIAPVNQGVNARVGSDFLNGPACEALEKYGLNIDEDGMYEIGTPPARSPASLSLVTKGLVSTGWLPQNAQGVVTGHVSIGTAETEMESFDTAWSTQAQAVTLLRAVELIGGTSPKRLIAPITKAQSASADPELGASYSWNARGFAGVKLYDYPDEDETQWEGENARMEFRTLRYRTPELYAQTLDALYFLTRGMRSQSGSAAHDRYRLYALDFAEYAAYNQLPDCNSIELNDFFYMHDTVDTKQLDTYLRPYANHLRDADTAPLRRLVRQAVIDLSEEFGMRTSPNSMLTAQEK